MKISRKEKGAVSVFLVIILVPCLLVASIFVDIGRVKLSKGMADASAELALNTLLTNYDADLNEWYGMVASCQSIEEFYDISGEYFIRCLRSQELEEDEIELLSGEIAALWGDDSVYDYLYVEAVDDVTVAAVDNADLTNAELIKSQIIDFMKYRAPYVVAEDIVGRLNGDSSVSAALEADDNEPLVEAKQAFYEADSELVEASYESFKNLYNGYTAYNFLNDDFQVIIDSINNYRNLYEEIHTLMVENYYNTSGLGEFNRPTVTSNSSYSCSSSGCYSRKEEVTDDYGNVIETIYYLDGAEFQSLYNSLSTAKTTFETKKQNLYQAVNSRLTYTENVTYDIQYWKRAVDILNGTTTGTNYISEFTDAARAMLDANAKLNAAMGCTMGENLPSNYESDYNALKAQVEGYKSKYLTAGQTDSGDSYLVLMNRLESISSENIDNIKYGNAVLSNGSSIDAALAEISGNLEGWKNTLQLLKDNLDVVINGLDPLSDLADEYNEKLGAWSDEAYAIETDMAKEDRTEITDLESAYAEKISSENVEALRTRLSNIQTRLQAAIDAIDELTYASEALTGITGYSTFLSKAQNSGKISSDDIPYVKSELDAYAASTFAELFDPSSNPAYTEDTLYGTDAYNLQLNPDTDKCYSVAADELKNNDLHPAVAVPELYQFFYLKFYGASDEAVEDAKQQRSDAETAIEEQKNAAENMGSDCTAADITRDFSEDKDSFGLGGAISGLIDVVDNLCNGNFDDIRDDLYLSVYAMNMFSYDTYEREGRYHLVEGNIDSSVCSVTNVEDLNKSNYEGAYQAFDTAWASEDPKDDYNKSLTNHLISGDNNYAYGAEIEYILYGKTSSKENVSAAYGDIFAIREVLNLVSGFANFWSSTAEINTAFIVNTISLALSVATCGIVPQGIIKVVLITLLSTFETVNDMNRLKAGFPVELYKVSEEYWHYSLSDTNTSGISGALSKINEIATEGFQNDRAEGLFYSDYLTFFVVLGFQGDNSEQMTLRMAEVVQYNVQKVTGNSNFNMKNAKVYFTLNAKLKVDPLLMTLPIYGGYNDSYDSSATDWCTYEISLTRGY